MFDRADVRWFSRTVLAFYSARTVADFVGVAGTHIHTYFRSIATACEELQFHNGLSRYALHGVRAEFAAPRDYLAYVHDNPLARFVESDRPPAILHMRADVGMAEWCRTDHFNGVASPMGWHDAAVVLGRTRSASTLFFGVYRDSVFSQKECNLLRVLQGHVLCTWERIQAMAGTDPLGPVWRVPLNIHGTPQSLPPPVSELFQAYFGRAKGGWPDRVRAWAAESARLLSTPGTEPLRPLRVDSLRGRLLLRYYAAGGEGRSGELIIVETPAAQSFFDLTRHGLTQRECEVLHGLAQGKRDADIADQLSTAVRTTSKHVEHILSKLGVENRSAAVAAAKRLLNSGPRVNRDRVEALRDGCAVAKEEWRMKNGE